MKRDFKGIWIPREIWLSEEIGVLDKIVLAEIDSLDNEDGCFASNAYFAKFFNISVTRVSNIISNLKKLGYIEEVGFNGRNRVLQGRLKEKFKAGLNKSLRQPQTIFKGRLKEKFKHNNIDNNKGDSKEETSPSDLKEKKTISEPNSGKVQYSSVDPTETRHYAKSHKITPDEQLILAQYKKHIYPRCTEKTQSFRDGVVEALDLFNEVWDKNIGAEMLVTGIRIFAENDFWKEKLADNAFLRTPKLFFRRAFLENNIIPLMNEKYGDNNKTKVSEEDVAKRKEQNEKAISDFLGKDN